MLFSLFCQQITILYITNILLASEVAMHNLDLVNPSSLQK